jgi:hypothetical protein
MAFWHKWFAADSVETLVENMSRLEDRLNSPPVDASKAEEPAPFVPPEPKRTFTLGLACPQKHARDMISGYSKHSEFPSICEECGGVLKPAIISGVWYLSQYLCGWRDREFVRWLKKPTGK